MHRARPARAAARPTRPTAAIRVRQRKSPGTQRRSSQGRQGSAPASTSSANQPGGRHGYDRDAQRRTQELDDRRCGGRGDVKRPAVAANVHRRSRDQRAQFEQVDLRCDDAVAAGAKSPAYGVDDLRRRVGLGRAGHTTLAGRGCPPDQLHRQFDERVGGPALERVAGADVHRTTSCSGAMPSGEAARSPHVRPQPHPRTSRPAQPRDRVGRQCRAAPAGPIG